MDHRKLIIRPPLAVTAYMYAFGFVWLGIVGSLVVASLFHGAFSVSLVALLMFLGGASIVGSNVRMRVVGHGDELSVRNHFTEQSHHRTTIDRFVQHAPNGMPSIFGGGTAMLLSDGRLIELRATQSGPFGRSRRRGHLDQLETWLNG